MTQQRFEDIVLDGVLPQGARLVVDTRLQNVILVKGNALLEQVHLGRSEVALLYVLCSTFPLGCSFVRLLAAMKDISEEDAHVQLVDAVALEDKAGYERVLHPVRALISRLRLDISSLCVDIRPDKEGMYALVKPLQRRTTTYDRIKASLETPGEDTATLRIV